MPRTEAETERQKASCSPQREEVEGGVEGEAVS